MLCTVLRNITYLCSCIYVSYFLQVPNLQWTDILRLFNDTQVLYRRFRQGAPIKNDTLGKFIISVIVIDIFIKFAVYTQEDCTRFRYNIWFYLKIISVWTYKYVFLGEQVSKLRFWLWKCTRLIYQWIIVYGAQCYNVITIRDTRQSWPTFLSWKTVLLTIGLWNDMEW